MLEVIGYDIFGQNKLEGMRYAWLRPGYARYIESASFVNKSKGKNEGICGYTTSVSAGCVLAAQKLPCSFCRTGNLLPFRGFLTYKEIAKQNVFMVLVDMYQEAYPELRNKKREFAYMGQGEPGFSYSQVRMAIELTNKVMHVLGQQVYRHIFATCGITEAIYNYKDDVKNYFTEKVTLHISLHATKEREKLMPIDRIYPYGEVIKAIDDISDITGEKPCIGIMLFNQFSPKSQRFNYTNSKKNVLDIINRLNPQKCRLSFCEYNSTDDLGKAEVYSRKEVEELLYEVQKRGFETKYFSSFGQDKKAACGMLGGKEPEYDISDKWQKLSELADKLIIENAN
ncbi:hypothetical protein DW708_08675 [Ruminococcus sp. AM27-11LB]|uniref:hypothetical protein n=1 Tax=Mediterraneibacter TaxID=2316020 RepID=UPI000E4674C5|nr:MULTISPECIES: hypothetical protein [Mediterraneibacter]RGH94773.1 hypothetical protein DW719_02345 [Ruminococcus sp. AM27-27]RGH95285.1 hypothetical protein DW708_08675 [Ruminococcus sp. AM27-11LB]